jgi:hypothetical protein
LVCALSITLWRNPIHTLFVVVIAGVFRAVFFRGEVRIGISVASSAGFALRLGWPKSFWATLNRLFEVHLRDSEETEGRCVSGCIEINTNRCIYTRVLERTIMMHGTRIEELII